MHLAIWNNIKQILYCILKILFTMITNNNTLSMMQKMQTYLLINHFQVIQFTILHKTNMNIKTANIRKQTKGLPSRLIEQIRLASPQKIIGHFIGVVLRVARDDRYFSFIVSDGSETAEVSLVYERPNFQLQMPKQGDSVEFIGTGLYKTLGNLKNSYSFAKIFASSMSRISLQRQLSIGIQCAMGCRQRQQQPKENQHPILSFIDRDLQKQCDPLTIRSLILLYVYYVFEHNQDIKTYLFNAEMVRSSKNGKQFLMSHVIGKKKMDQLIQKEINELCLCGVIWEKRLPEKGGSGIFYLIKKDILLKIEQSFETKIKKEGQKGVQIDTLTNHVNQQIKQYTKLSGPLIDLRFAQSILMKLQSLNRVYKTSDKKVFPNSYS